MIDRKVITMDGISIAQVATIEKRNLALHLATQALLHIRYLSSRHGDWLKDADARRRRTDLRAERRGA